MSNWEIKRKDGTLIVRKDGEHYAKTPVQTERAVEVYTHLYESRDFRFDFYYILMQYYLDDAPTDWSMDYERNF